MVFFERESKKKKFFKKAIGRENAIKTNAKMLKILERQNSKRLLEHQGSKSNLLPLPLPVERQGSKSALLAAQLALAQTQAEEELAEEERERVKKKQDEVLSRLDDRVVCAEHVLMNRLAHRSWFRGNWTYGYNTPEGTPYRVHEGPEITRPFVKSLDYVVASHTDRLKHKELKRLVKKKENEKKPKEKKDDGPEFLNMGQTFSFSMLADQDKMFKFALPEIFPSPMEIILTVAAFRNMGGKALVPAVVKFSIRCVQTKF